MTTLHNYALCFVTDESLSNGRTSVHVTEEALKGGATIIQLRDKGRDRDFLVRTGEKIKQLCNRYGAFFVVNDSIDIAKELAADGVHLGQSDMPAHEARKILGGRAIVGIPVSTPEEAVKAEREGASYLGAGPVFETGSKSDAVSPIHLEGLEAIAASVSIPVMAIGGISVHNAADIARTGACGIAVISAISMADDIAKAAEDLYEEFTNG